ncbi:poly(A) RNA polymerase gld-2 homolog B isoform X1 [Stomoxys calcitrans]|uniref:poly(A) RNA polymerase gld-2 homolog B isoform X1 n=1 Tax=Stomoxys calcitrans TaxID=35570 RepID=UPI0027E30B17|nr:poly(A) RNA polymerase gld-2 homolog B isoform X1 [Stomoxys calcitrans]
MGSKIVNLEIFLIYFLLLIPWPHTHVIKRLCSKDSSRLVRKIVRSKWTPILDKYQVKLPLECPLHPFRDIFAPRQDAKKRDRPTQWTCRLCGKSFYQEKFLDLHFETRHKAIINEAEDAVCLADYCDIMRCEVFQTEESSSLKIGDQNIVTDIEVWGDSFGQNSALAKANVAYLSLLPIRTSSIGASRAAKVQNRQLCQDKIGQTKCQQTETSNENYIYSTNNNNNGASRTKYTPHIQTPAESLTSSAAPHIYSSSSSSSSSSGASRSQKTYSTTSSSSTSNSAYSSGSGTSGSGTTSTSSNTKESTSHHADGGAEHNTRTENSNSDDSVKTQTNTSDDDERSKTSGNNGQMSTMQKIRANCKAEELIKLKSKCEFLVRTCIGGLILSMSDQQFRDMEEEMNKAVCWYLTCERYWEDGPLEPRAFPWGLIVILIFVLSSGICFCYYIIWILFDSEEATINANTNANHLYHTQQMQHQHLQHQQQQQQQHRQHIYIPASHQHQLQHHPSQIQDHYHFQEYPTTGIHHHGMSNVEHPSSSNTNQYYYHQAQGEVGHHDMYPEPVQYDYRHSPRRYIGDQRRPGTPITMATGQATLGTQSGGAQTPLRHPTNLAYQQDILDRRDYINSRAHGTSVVSSHNTLASTRGPNTGSSGALSSLGHHSQAQLDCDSTLPATHLGSSGGITASTMSGDGIGGGGAVGGMKHYNTIPRPLEPRQRYVSGSQQSLRASSSTHEIIQNEVGHNEHYIYVTYPPDLKKRFFEKYE